MEGKFAERPTFILFYLTWSDSKSQFGTESDIITLNPDPWILEPPVMGPDDFKSNGEMVSTISNVLKSSLQCILQSLRLQI